MKVKISMTVYSAKPLVTKLGVKPGWSLYIKNAPANYHQLLNPLPEKVTIRNRLYGKINMVHLFSKNRNELQRELKRYLPRIEQDGVIWISWPKKASKIPSTVCENVIREIALPLGLVDTKVCAVNEIWSGLKLVIRVENRKK